MKSEATSRFGTQGDAELLAELGRETFHDAFFNHPQMPQKDLSIYLDESFTVTRLSEELADEKSIFLLAEIAGEAVGYAKLETNSRAYGMTAKNPIKLKRLYSKRKFIGSGIGASLIKRCLQEAVERNHDAIWLTVWEHNLHAQTFYRKWGFESCGSIEFLLGESVLSDIVMQRHLYTSNYVNNGI